MAMQVIYSAGTTSPLGSPRASPRAIHRSPKPSPMRSPRGVEGWRPVMPGYRPPLSNNSTVQVQHVTETDSNLKDTIPAMSRPVAIICFVCNILSPGLGTFVSGLTVLCGSRPRPRSGNKRNIIWVNTWVAVLQFLTAFLFLLGWIWSIMWGASFLTIAEESRTAKETETPLEKGTHHSDSSSDDNSAVAHRLAGRNISNTRTTTNRTVALPDTREHAQSAHMGAPIIVLQEAPVIILPDATHLEMTQQHEQTQHQQHHERTLNPNNPRHQRILRRQQLQRQNSDDVPPIFLDPQQLEQIVLHQAPTPEAGNGNPPHK